MEKKNERTTLLKLGAVALGLGALVPTLFYREEFGVNIPIFFAAVIAGALSLARVYRREVPREISVIAALSFVFAAWFGVRASELLLFFDFVFAAFLGLLSVRALAIKPLSELRLAQYLSAIFLPLRFITPFYRTFALVATAAFGAREDGKGREIVRGVLLALLVLIPFTLLFASADQTFERILSELFNIEWDEAILHRTILGVIGTAFFLGMFGFLFLRAPHAAPAPSASAPRELGTTESLIVLASVNTLFFAFLALQLSYLFGGESYLASAGSTYAAYAREGFFELVLVGIFVFAILSTIERQIRGSEEGIVHFRIAGVLLVVQTVFVLVSAYSRLSLYEEAYGFTVIRLFSHAFMIWLAAALVLLAHHTATGGSAGIFACRILGSVAALLLAMNIINPDAFIARQNLERYAATGEIDAWYLGRLSADALPETIRLLDDPNARVRDEYTRGLYWSWQLAARGGESDAGKKPTVMSWNASRARGDALLISQSGHFEAYEKAEKIGPYAE